MAVKAYGSSLIYLKKHLEKEYEYSLLASSTKQYLENPQVISNDPKKLH